MTLSLVIVGFFFLAHFTTILRPSDFVAFEETTTFEAYVFQHVSPPREFSELPFYLISIYETAKKIDKIYTCGKKLSQMGRVPILSSSILCSA